MSYNLVDPTTGDLTRVAGGTLYADLPIGSWVKNDMDTLPSGFLKEGDAISQSEYPELYAKYGSTVPYKADTSELSDYEPLTIGTNAGSATTALYDGIFRLTNGTCEAAQYYVSTDGGTTYSTVGASAGGGIPNQNYATSSTLYLKKGWKFYVAPYGDASSVGLSTNGFIAYYKKSLIVKAKQVAVPADFMNAVAETNSYLTSMLPEFKNLTTGNADELRSFANNKLYSLKVHTPFNVMDDNGTSYKIPMYAEAIFYKHSGDITVQFHSYYGTPGIWEVFYNSNGQTRGKKIA